MLEKVYVAFIRHGDYHQLADTPSAFQPFALNENGEQQAVDGAHALASFIQANGIKNLVWHTSVLQRAWQTAHIMRQHVVGVNEPTTSEPTVETVALAERCVGSLANLSVTQIEEVIEQDERYPTLKNGWKSDSHFCLPYPGAESLMQAGERVARYIQQVVATNNKSHTLIVFVGHGAAFRHAAYCLKLLTFDQISQLSMYHATPVISQVIDTPNEQPLYVHMSGDWKTRVAKSQYTD